MPECPPGPRTFRILSGPCRTCQCRLSKRDSQISPAKMVFLRVSRKYKLGFHHLEKKLRRPSWTESMAFLLVGSLCQERESHLYWALLLPQGMRLPLVSWTLYNWGFCLVLHRYFYIILFITLYWSAKYSARQQDY